MQTIAAAPTCTKSTLTNQIFQQEMLHLYEQKTVSRDELVREARASMLALVKEMRQGICDHPEAEQRMWDLAQALDGVKGQKKYGYLPKRVKKLVDEVVDEMERLPAVAKCYEQWQTLQGEVEGYYSDAPPKKQKLSQRKEFRQIKNAVVAEAEHLRLSVLTFEGEQRPGEDDGYDHTRNEWYWRMKRLLDDPEEPIENKDWAVSGIRELADYGVPQAWYVLGTLYRDGGILIPDSILSAEVFTKAAQAGMIPAQCALGELLLSDDLDVRDPPAGMEWLERAWEGGSLYAGYCLARECLSGDNIPKDVERGLATIRLLHSMSQIFQDNSLPKHSPAGMRTDRKLLQKIREKKIAMGHKPEDHPDEGMIMGW